MAKKSQISYFLLAGVAIVSIGAVFYFTSHQKNLQGMESVFSRLPLEIQAIDFFINACIRNTLEDAVWFTSKHGGYYEVPENSYSNYGLMLPYYFYDNARLIPTKQQIENQIESYVNDSLQYCLGNFSQFKEQGFDIQAGGIVPEVHISSNELNSIVKIPIDIKQGEKTYQLGSFNNRLDNIGIGRIMSFADDFVNEQSEHPSTICISCLNELAAKYDLLVHLERHENQVILFRVLDNNTIVRQKNLQFFFVNKYFNFSCESLPPGDIDFIQECASMEIEKLNPQIRIDPIPDFTIHKGDHFYYDVNATGRNLMFEDSTDLFIIQKLNGTIDFTASENDIGRHNILIFAKNNLGMEDFASFTLDVAK